MESALGARLIGRPFFVHEIHPGDCRAPREIDCRADKW
jgi:hypothetical protein